MEKTDKKEILDAFAQLVTHVDKRFDGLEDRMSSMEGRMDGIERHMTGLEKRMDGMEGHMTGLEERMDGMEKHMNGMEERMGGTEERLGALAQEVRSGFEKYDERLCDVEEAVQALSRTIDSLTEGDVLGKKHITLTRPEYDTMVSTLHLPNRFKSRTP